MADRTRPSSVADATPAGGTAARYGTGRSPWLTRGGAVVLAVLSVVAAYAFARPLFGSPQTVRFAVVGFALDEATQAVTVRWTVDRPDDVQAVCVVRSRREDGAEVGRAEVPVPTGTGGTRVDMSYRLATAGVPVTGEVTDCGVLPEGDPVPVLPPEQDAAAARV